MTDHRVLTIRRWLLLIAAAVLCLCCEPGLWFCLFAAPIIWTRTSGGTTGILIHPDGAGGWKIAVGDSADATCACCGFGNCDQCSSQHEGSMQVVVASVTDGTNCGNCNALNGTYELPKIAACRWQLDLDITLTGGGCSTDCGSSHIQAIDFFLNGGFADGNFICSSGSARRWTGGITGDPAPFNCAGFSNANVNDIIGDVNGCNNSSGTFRVTTLP